MPPRRQIATRSAPARKAVKPEQTSAPSPDTLASALVSALVISAEPGPSRSKHQIPQGDITSEERCLAAMRAVNSSSKRLSGIVAAGWRQAGVTGRKSGHSVAEVIKWVEDISSNLNLLRILKAGDVDVERAASSVVGKLLSLDLYNVAVAFVMDTHDPLVRLYIPAFKPPSPYPPAYFIAMPPIPATEPVPSELLVSLICSYFVHSLSIFCTALRTLSPPSAALDANTFVSAVHENTASQFLSWLPYFSSRPSRRNMVDSACTKIYTVVTKTCSLLASPSALARRQGSDSSDSVASTNSSVIFRLRTFTFICLAFTSSGTVESEAFWNELGKAVAEYKDSDANARQHLILQSMDRIITSVERREDRASYLDLQGRHFRAVLDGWLAIARAANDTTALDRITGLLNPGLQSTQTDSQPFLSAALLQSSTLDQGEAMRVYTLLTTTEALFTQDADSSLLEDRISVSVQTIRKSRLYLSLNVARLSDEYAAADNVVQEKVCRAFERVRRLAAKTLEKSAVSPSDTPHTLCRLARQLLNECAATFETVLVESKAAITSTAGQALLLSWLDTLFVLSKATLVFSRSDSYGLAFDWLENAWCFLQAVPSEILFANHLRILSGAFYSLAGTLYRSGEYAHASRFLERGCTVGARALKARQQQVSDSASASQTSDQEVWTVLEESLYKRWEVLGVCHSKTGDRRLAYQAFLEAVKTFPFFAQPFLEVAHRTSASLLFSSFPVASNTLSSSSPFLSPAVLQLGILIDRITYMGICELFLEPHDVSLRQHFVVQDDSGRIVVGALLERQIHSLESSRYKLNVKKAISTLLKDTLEVYQADGEMPLRRAHIQLTWLEGSYHEPTEFTGVRTDIQAVGDEVQRLLSREDFALDAHLIHLRAQYQIMLHLWLALHIHRSGNTTDYAQIADHSEAACKVLKAMLHTIPQHGHVSLTAKSKMVSPKHVVAPAKKAMGRSTTKVKTTTARSRTTKALPAPPITPKLKKGSQVTSTNLLTQIPVSNSQSMCAPWAFDGLAKLCDLLQAVSQLLGLLGHVVVKIHLLSVTRRLCERYMDTKPEDFIQVSLDLGNEYAKLGKTERAASVYVAVRNCFSISNVPDELKALYFLRYAELLSSVGNILRGASMYCEAANLLERLETEDDKAVSTVARVNVRVTTLERVAVAATSFATLQYSKDDPTASLNGLLQALRLYHRAVDTLARLVSPIKPTASDNPFDMSGMKDALKSVQNETPGHQQVPAPDNPAQKSYVRRSSLSSLEWRIASGLLSTLFSLAQAYLARGSAREAEYFVNQAKDLAESLNAPAMICRALIRLAELKLGLGKLTDAHECLREAANLVADGVGGVDAVDLRRLKGELSSKSSDDDKKHAITSYEEAMMMLEDLDERLAAHDSSVVGLRRSSSTSPRSSLSPQHDSLMPSRFVAVLRRSIALLHGAGEEYHALLDRLRALPMNLEAKTEESSLLAKLALEDAYARFRADMLLGSLAESTITLPIGMTGELIPTSATTQEILGTLSVAEKLFWSDLALVARRGKVSHVRDAVVSLALIKAFQTSLGQSRTDGPTLTTRLLDSSAAITLRREMLEVIQHKFRDVVGQDDLQWPLITQNGSVIHHLPKPTPPPISPVHRPRGRSVSSTSSTSDANDCEESTSSNLAKTYWDFIASRYESQLYDASALRTSQTSFLPHNWSVISITLTSDHKSLFITRQRKALDPLIFCIPLKGRRQTEDNDDEDGKDNVPDGGQMGYAEVIRELNDVIRLSDEGTRGAVNVDKNDKNARAKWWKERSELDKRMKMLLENVEFCWLGAFKTILSEPTPLPPNVLASFRSRLEYIFVRTLLPPAPAPSQSRPKHKAKSSSSSKNSARLAVALSDTLLETCANLSHTAPSEEIEDLAYFILDLYAFHGGPNMGVIVAEVDMDELVLDIRGALEEVSAARQKQLEQLKRKAGAARDQDHHTFLILDKNVQAIPWECIPILRGRSVSRIPSMEFLIDRILWAKHQRGQSMSSDLPEAKGASTAEDVKAGGDFADAVEDASSPIDRVTVDPTNAFVILNPSGDLKNTEGRFVDWVLQMQKGVGWEAIIGRAPSESEMAYALGKKDLVIYFGHGGAEQYIRSHKIRHLERCAATMLWGCSSGTLREMGEFDRVGTPLNYVMAGCPALVANLWDVTDRDIDKYSQAVFDKMHLAEVADVRSWQSEHIPTASDSDAGGTRRPMSIVRAIAESRDACKLKYLTGAAPVVYGIPFYL